MAANPVFVGTPRVAVGQVSAANTNRDGTGTIVTVFTAGSLGGRVDKVEITAAGTTTAGVVRLYIATGATIRLWKEVMVNAITPSTTIEVFRSVYEPSGGLMLATGQTLQASTHNAETFNVAATGGDF